MTTKPFDDKVYVVDNVRSILCIEGLAVQTPYKLVVAKNFG